MARRHLPKLRLFILTLAALCLPLSTSAAPSGIPWNLQRLFQSPHVYPAATPAAAGMRGIFFEGLPWQARPTRVFAWISFPSKRPTEKIPAIVLVHGGGGTAFADWVKLWTDRGYAAIAIDTCGSVPSNGFGEPPGMSNRPRHEFAGPACWDASFEQVTWPVEDQWTYHAVADIILADSLLRSFPEIDPARIGITGVSWGGYLTAIAASVDPRFRFAVPVYGCGFLGEDSVWMADFAKMGEARARRWLDLWDPSVYLPLAKTPFLWVSGTNDFAYPLDSLQKSYRLTQGPYALCIRLRMAHGHGGPGEKPAEILAFADQNVRRGSPLASISSQGRKQRDAWVAYLPTGQITRAELTYTTDDGAWKDRRWFAIPAKIESGETRITATLPPGVSTYFFNLEDNRGLIVSSQHQQLEPHER